MQGEQAPEGSHLAAIRATPGVLSGEEAQVAQVRKAGKAPEESELWGKAAGRDLGQPWRRVCRNRRPSGTTRSSLVPGTPGAEMRGGRASLGFHGEARKPSLSGEHIRGGCSQHQNRSGKRSALQGAAVSGFCEV